MTTTTHSPPTVVKWPFFAGDGLCITTMAAILALTDRPLTGGVTVAVVVCLLVGAILAIIPYLIEYEGRLRVAEASAHASIEIQVRKAAGFAEQLNHSVSRSQATAEEIEKVLASNEESMEKLAELVENIDQWTAGDNAPGGSDGSKSAESLKLIEAELQKLIRTTVDLAGREHLTPDHLQSALADLNLRLVTAIERLIETSSNPRPGSELAGANDQTAGAVPETDNTDPPKPDPFNQTAQAEKSELPENPTVETKGGEGGSSAISQVDSLLEQSEPAEGEPHFTFNEKSTSLIATAYIGIGNKLFLRGDGPGLSWEEGVPMQFLSIGKWGWSTLEVDGTVTCRIYKNDDEPAIDGDIVLNPAELKEISPRF